MDRIAIFSLFADVVLPILIAIFVIVLVWNLFRLFRYERNLKQKKIRTWLEADPNIPVEYHSVQIFREIESGEGIVNARFIKTESLHSCRRLNNDPGTKDFFLPIPEGVSTDNPLVLFHLGSEYGCCTKAQFDKAFEGITQGQILPNDPVSLFQETLRSYTPFRREDESNIYALF